MKGKQQDEIIIGTRPLEEAIMANKSIDKVWFQKGLKNEIVIRIRKLLADRKIIYQDVPLQKLNKITRKNHQGVIAFISPISFHDIEEVVMASFEKGKSPFILILDRVTDVRNFGAIVRSAEFFGVDAIVVPSRGGARVNFDSIKTSAGAIFNVPICKADNLYRTIKHLKASGLKVVSLTEKGSRNIRGCNFSAPLAIIVGSEEDGVSSDLLKISDELLKIEKIGNTDSLNVSVACSIALFHFNQSE